MWVRKSILEVVHQFFSGICHFFTRNMKQNHVIQFALVIRLYLFPIYTNHHFLPNAHCPLICIKHQLLFPIEAAGGLLQNIFPRNHTHFSGGPFYIYTCGKRCITTSNIDDGLPLFSGGFQFSAEVAAEVGAQGQWSSAAGDWCWWWLPWWWWWWFFSYDFNLMMVLDDYDNGCLLCYFDRSWLTNNRIHSKWFKVMPQWGKVELVLKASSHAPWVVGEDYNDYDLMIIIVKLGQNIHLSINQDFENYDLWQKSKFWEYLKFWW